MIFGLGKKRRQPTFKEHVTAFWDWYPQVADRFYRTIEAGECAGLADEVSEFVATTLPHLSWVFGPGENGGHSFTVTGEGQIPKQLLAEYWRSRAPTIPGWTFYASRQPTPMERLKDLAIRVGEEEQVDVEGFLIKTSVDEESKLINLVAWHPALKQVPADHHFQILFLLLDEALGEFGTQTWLGDIKIEPFPAASGTRSLAQLPGFLQQVQEYHQWEKLSPLESYSVYEVQEASKGPRGDSVVGSTCIPHVVMELLENRGRLREDPLAETGAEFAYLAIDGSVFPQGKQAEVRGNIEDALSDALEADLSGRVLGGAFGTQNSYIDLLLFDGENSRQIVQKTLEQLQLARQSQFRSFV